MNLFKNNFGRLNKIYYICKTKINNYERPTLKNRRTRRTINRVSRHEGSKTNRLIYVWGMGRFVNYVFHFKTLRNTKTRH